MPIKRFADFLERRGELKDYMDLLVRNFNADTVDNVMCRDTISVDYTGKLYDCDFNQQLGMGILGKADVPNGDRNGAIGTSRRQPLTVFDLESCDDLLPLFHSDGSSLLWMYSRYGFELPRGDGIRVR